MDPNCTICKGEGWVCEDHPKVPWDGGSGHGEDCGGAGQLCICNPQDAAPSEEGEAAPSDG